MRIMESRVKSIIREEVSRAIRSRLLREADPDYPYMPDARSNSERDAYFARDEEDDEEVDGYYGDDDPFGDDAAIEAGIEYGPNGYDNSVINAFNKMKPKPEGLIIDCSEMEGSGGGRYPLYQATGGKIKKLSDDAGVAAFAFTDMLAENGELPEGCWVAGPSDGGDGPFEITNKV